ncbi:NAD(P)/FAD-dependent oxidoreductase [Flindersiella endophytica]
MTARPKVLILGGGFAGLETAFTLRHRYGVDADITLVSDHDRFLYQPGLVEIPFGGAERRLYVPIRRPLLRRDITFLQGRVSQVDPALDRVSLVDGTRLPFDFLVIATGATTSPEELPGLGDFAATIDSPARVRELGWRLRTLAAWADQGQRRRVLFLVPPGRTDSGPVYETALRADTFLRKRDVRDRVELHLATWEPALLSGDEPGVRELAVRELGSHGISFSRHRIAGKVIGHCVEFEDGSNQEYDLLVSYPPVAPAVVYPALPADARGFVRTDPVSRQVVHHPGIYAPGDAGDSPVRQALPALAQAGVVADGIAAQLGPGGRAVASRLALDSVRMSPLWATGNHVLRAYVSMRFRAGRPFWPGSVRHDRTSR